MKNKWAILFAALVLLGAALYVSSDFDEGGGGYAQVLQDRQARLNGQGNDGRPGTQQSDAQQPVNQQSEMQQAEAQQSKTQQTEGRQSETQQTEAREIEVRQSEADLLEEAPDFTLKDLDGNSVSLQDLRGKAVYLNFWTTWCKWCKKEMPAMKRVHASFEGEDLAIVAVDIGEDRDKVAAYIAKGEYPFPVLLDSDKSVSKAYRVTSIPVSVFVDREGRIAYRKLGTMKEDEMRSVLEALVE
ncbi:TlpA disulfide reductase family protein [Cohnella sp. GbtcB17]|uniref:TlpA family protein disulfide reductase n=1 Tax=Cohnella sp. GbtcB17 TaxID=2824762 RepID=UPI001C30AEF9|nr:TlpA disulfide reductase family protein [Cohnella sp. GbtcB17]